MDYEKLDNARKLLELAETASLKEIKDSYRKLALKYHPDRCSEKEKQNSEEKFKRITAAYKIIMDYCAAYRYSFKKETAEQISPEEDFSKHMQRFYEDWF